VIVVATGVQARTAALPLQRLRWWRGMFSKKKSNNWRSALVEGCVFQKKIQQLT